MDQPGERTATEGVDRIVEALLREQGGDLTARVRLPPPDRLEIQMVPAAMVRDLDELRSRASFWVGAASISTSVPIAIAVAWLTQTHPHPTIAAVVVLSVFVTLAAIGWMLATAGLLTARRKRAALFAQMESDRA